MKNPQDILNHLHDLDFREEELKAEMEEMLDTHKDFAANRSVRQYQRDVRRFKDVRNQRLDCEFNDLMVENNELRLQTKLARAQNQYKENRRIKKNKNKNKNLKKYQALK